MAFRNPPQIPLSVSRFDNVFIGVGLTFILGLSVCYYLETGTFLLLHTLDGSMTTDNAFEFREQYVYGLKNWPIYNIAFTMLPTFISMYALLRSQVSRKIDLYFFLIISVCFGASLSLGSKGGLIGFVLSFFVAQCVFLAAFRRISVRSIFSRRFMLFSVGCFVLLVIGYNKATPGGLSISQLLERLWYRTFVAYTEALAGAVSYAREVDFLGISVFPNIRGLLSHNQVNVSYLLHEYIAKSPGGVNLPFIGEAFLVSGWYSVFFISCIVCMVLIVLQEMSFALKSGITSLAFGAYYSYLAMQVSSLGMFSTLFTFMYGGTLVVLAIVTAVVVYFLELGTFDWSKV